MKIAAKILIATGVICVFMGMGAMDSDLLIVPIAMMITGCAVTLAGFRVEDQCI